MGQFSALRAPGGPRAWHYDNVTFASGHVRWRTQRNPTGGPGLHNIESWLAEYGDSHQHPTNKLIHWVCVPAIVFSVIGLLWSLPVPAAFAQISPALNWALLFAMAAIVYYFILSISLGIGATLVLAALLLLADRLDGAAAPLWATSLAIFVLAWIGQFIGHRIEGRKPSFFKDLQFLMIGPLWLLAAAYRRAGIPY
jgi:uncharacterized membrane protein YGL010W